MDLRTKTALVVVLAGVWLAGSARAGEITVTTFVNYGSAYRDQAWAPIDVLVVNDSRDVKGAVEVRLYTAAGDLISPIHRAPLESAKGSRKRFRIVAHLQDADRMEVQVFDKRRPLDQLPMVVKLSPIRSDDYLTLVLDDEVNDYGFLAGVALGDGGQRRFYRENLKDETLASLADHPACFRAFNVVILGDIDPSRISARHREVLTRYVEDGGVLVVQLGSNSAKYRGSWVAGLLGVEIGGQEIMTEDRLYDKAFGGPDRLGIKGSRQGVVATLTPAADDVTTYGRDMALATRRARGRGFAIAFAPDAAGRLLQDCPAYQALWKDIYAFRRDRRDLDPAAAGIVCQNLLPELTGVRIQPRSTVFIYLGLYFVVAIVLNWLFWDRLKRREMAWVSLIGFSFAFTAYAMIFGTVGRAKSTEIDRVDVLRVPGQGKLADLHSFLGILTARTSRFTASLKSDTALVSDLTGGKNDFFNPWNPNPGYEDNNGEARSLEPFFVVADTPIRLEEFLVRASEMRILRLQSSLAVPGGFTGSLVLDEDGLHGELQNESGWHPSELWLLFQGHIYRLAPEGETVPVSLDPKDLAGGHLDKLFRSLDRNPGRRGDKFQYEFVWQLFSESELPPDFNAYADIPDRVLSESAGPYLFAWLEPASASGLDLAEVELNRPAETNLRKLLAVFDVRVERLRTGEPTARDLAVKVSNAENGRGRGACGSWERNQPPANGNWPETACMLYNGVQADVEIFIPEQLRSRSDGDLTVELYTAGPSYADTFLSFAPGGDDGMDQWGLDHLTNAASLRSEGVPGQRLEFSVPDWRSRLDPRTGTISGKIYYASYTMPAKWGVTDEPIAADDSGEYRYFTLLARLPSAGGVPAEKEWPSWQ